ncbi:MAG TPA: LD-carboxypeptidase [Usitatibacter sp.]|nr:LD-carboxypeptidase [Usitatibacter sp.]
MAAALAGAATFAWREGFAARKPPLPLVRPPRVRAGDLVGLIAPGGAMEDAQIERAVRNIESMGLKVKTGANIRLRRGNYAGTPQQQVDDFHAMVRDREVKAIWSGRGGSGSSLLLPLLDYPLIRAHAKVFVGLSDVTALHLAILRLAGVVTFHGPAGVSTFSDYSMAYLRAAFMEPRASYTIANAPELRLRGESEPEYAERTLTPGAATGPLIGGNLSVLTALVGTPYAARMKDSVVFLEDVGEEPYRINRMLTQLVQSGELTRAAAVMFGACARCRTPPDEPALTLEETLRDRLEPLRVPAAMGLSFGHVAHHFTIPMGIRARFDASERTLTVLEPAVT